ncbi:MAG: ATP-dependent DNA helicase RecG [Niameybacter sp.]|uniref:ATP-dependent DNA helicase RecG n=1 Tax=Niameybacter sp. TaxID=2033640 RepID=UPI002FCA62DD
MFLTDSIMDLKGVGEQTIKKFNKIGIELIEDLVEHYPREYEDRRQITKIAEMVMEEDNNIVVTVASKPEIMKKGYKIIVKFRVKDDTGSIYVVFYGQPYMKNNFVMGETYNFYGKVKRQYNRIEMESPEYEKVEVGGGKTAKITPIYPTTQKLSQKVIRQLIEQALSLVLPEIQDPFPETFRAQYDLKSKTFALTNIHFPSQDEDFFEARKRLVFEELFFLQLSLFVLKSDFLARTKGCSKPLPESFKDFLAALPFEFTGAQKRVMNEIAKDLKSAYAGNRLVQGDVGSGKTVIAAASLFIAIKNGYQGALMAPTEVLAKQHFEFLEEVFQNFDVKVALLTGSTTAKEKRELLAGLKENQIDLIVGTHALIEDNVEIPRLGLVITDEQHRFGVRQRLKLSEKGETPDVIVMTATPIPRTLALILYGDMDISIIDELPPGRQPIKTNAVDSSYHARIYQFIDRHIREGRQCYIICPMVEENEKQSELKSVTEYAVYLKEQVFPHFEVGILHGKMKPKEKNQVMEAFAKGDIHVLVSTTVVEVGVNVPNATVMMIENAERFGLAQLHQLRGRVGRGKHQSYCVLVSDSKNKVTKKRLKIMEESTDGFVIADTDLKLRGPGDFFGTKQHGLPEMKIANLYTDAKVLKVAQQAAADLLKQDPDLSQPRHQALKVKLMHYTEGEKMHKAL